MEISNTRNIRKCPYSIHIWFSANHIPLKSILWSDEPVFSALSMAVCNLIFATIGRHRLHYYSKLDTLIHTSRQELFLSAADASAVQLKLHLRIWSRCTSKISRMQQFQHRASFADDSRQNVLIDALNQSLMVTKNVHERIRPIRQSRLQYEKCKLIAFVGVEQSIKWHDCSVITLIRLFITQNK